jgi:glycosyltransferase involved in cell wall biosynthesis
MKIGVVSGGFTGGAGIAARRVHDALCGLGEDSTFFFKHGEADTVPSSCKIGTDDVCFDILDRFSYDFDMENRSEGRAILSLPYPPVAPYYIDMFMEKCEILNMHWISGLMSPECMGYAVSKGKHLVWTLHDENPITAICHYRSGCEGYLGGCGECPQVKPEYRDLVRSVFLAKRDAYPKEMTIVTPSRWLAEEALKSPLLSGRRVEVIPNGLNTAAFSGKPRGEIRGRLGIAEDERLILCGAMSFGERRKGWGLLRSALRLLAERDSELKKFINKGKIKLLSFGEIPEDEAPALPHIGIGVSDDTRLIAGAYAAADVTVIPSVEDNLPNIMLESLSCGTPVVGFAVGGMPDVIQNGITGFLAPAGDVGALAGCICDALSGKTDRNACRAYAEKEFSLKKLGESYRELFRDVLLRPLSSKSTVIPNMSAPARRIFSYCTSQIIDYYNTTRIYTKSTVPSLVKLAEHLAEDKKIILFGAKAVAAAVFMEVFRSVSYVVDNNEKLHGTFVNGVEVRPPETLLAEPKDSCVVLIFVRNPAPVTAQLNSLGVGTNQMIVCD